MWNCQRKKVFEDLIATKIDVINKLEDELSVTKNNYYEEQKKYNELEKNFQKMFGKFNDFLKQSQANSVKLTDWV